jgi:hypothetical protein
MKGDNMERHRIMGAIGVILMIFICFILPSIITEIGDPFRGMPTLVPAALILALIISAFVLIIYAICIEENYRLKGTIVKDERTQKILNKSRSYTLSVTIIFLAILIVISQYQIIHLELKDIWLPVLIQIAITVIILKLYFGKKKDA